jgi:hypothetical protein
MTAPKEHHAAAATRAALDQQLYVLMGRSVKEVRITRVNWPEGKKWVAMVIGIHGREVPLYDGGLHQQAAMILREAFPHANWARAQDYDVKTGILREHIARVPSGPRGDGR